MNGIPILTPEAEGQTPEVRNLRLRVNLTAFFMLLLILFSVLDGFIYPYAEELVWNLFGGDEILYNTVLDAYDLVSYTCGFLFPLGIVLAFAALRGMLPDISFQPALPEHSISAIFASIGILYVFGSIGDAVLSLFEMTGVQFAGYDMPLPDTPLRVVLYFLSTVILPAFVEELAFRGFVLHLLLPYGKVFAVITSGVLFGLMHGYLPQLLFASAAGILIGYFVVRSDSLWIGVFIHLTTNLMSFLFDMAYQFLPEEVYSLLSIALEGAIYLAAFAGILVLYRHFAEENGTQPLESASTYTRLLDTESAFRSLLTLPMLFYAAAAVYQIMVNSVLF